MKGGRFVEQGGKTATIAKQMICQQFDGSDLADLRLAVDPTVLNLRDRLVLINGGAQSIYTRFLLRGEAASLFCANQIDNRAIFTRAGTLYFRVAER